MCLFVVRALVSFVLVGMSCRVLIYVWDYVMEKKDWKRTKGLVRKEGMRCLFDERVCYATNLSQLLLCPGLVARWTLVLSSSRRGCLRTCPDQAPELPIARSERRVFSLVQMSS